MTTKTDRITLADIANLMRVDYARAVYLRDTGQLGWVRTVGDAYVSQDVAVAMITSGEWAKVMHDDMLARVAADREFNAAIKAADDQRIADGQAADAAVIAKNAAGQRGKAQREAAVNAASLAASGAVRI